MHKFMVNRHSVQVVRPYGVPTSTGLGRRLNFGEAPRCTDLTEDRILGVWNGNSREILGWTPALR